MTIPIKLQETAQKERFIYKYNPKFLISSVKGSQNDGQSILKEGVDDRKTNE